MGATGKEQEEIRKLFNRISQEDESRIYQIIRDRIKR
jgi:hypothetical protein